jgi:polyphenol oxidase
VKSKKPSSASRGSSSQIESKDIASIDRFLSEGGFRRAANPKGALGRSRSDRDKRNNPKKASPFTIKKQLRVVKVPGWGPEWLIHGFSTRSGGYSTVFGGNDLNLGFVKQDSRATVERNRRAFLAAVGAGEVSKVITLKQIHSSRIHVLQSSPKRLLTGDGVITDRPGLLLSVLTADCVPILLFDSKTGSIGAFHAGWRGTAKRIIQKGVGMMRLVYGTEPKDIRAAIGPCIQQCCYAVGEEVVEEFDSQFPYAGDLFREMFDDDPVKTKYPLLFLTARAPGHGPVGKQPHLDLNEANRRQLFDAGVPYTNIWSADLCTGCNTDRLFSHRKEDGFTGRMMAVIGKRGR